MPSSEMVGITAGDRQVPVHNGDNEHLLSDTFSQGIERAFLDRVHKAKGDPAPTAFEASAAMAVGIGLAVAFKNPEMWAGSAGLAAKVVVSYIGVKGGLDLVKNVALPGMSGHPYEAGRTLGSRLFDYSVAGISGLAGYVFAARVAPDTLGYSKWATPEHRASVDALLERSGFSPKLEFPSADLRALRSMPKYRLREFAANGLASKPGAAEINQLRIDTILQENHYDPRTIDHEELGQLYRMQPKAVQEKLAQMEQGSQELAFDRQHAARVDGLIRGSGYEPNNSPQVRSRLLRSLDETNAYAAQSWFFRSTLQGIAGDLGYGKDAVNSDITAAKLFN